MGCVLSDDPSKPDSPWGRQWAHSGPYPTLGHVQPRKWTGEFVSHIATNGTAANSTSSLNFFTYHFLFCSLHFGFESILTLHLACRWSKLENLNQVNQRVEKIIYSNNLIALNCVEHFITLKKMDKTEFTSIYFQILKTKALLHQK